MRRRLSFLLFLAAATALVVAGAAPPAAAASHAKKAKKAKSKAKAVAESENADQAEATDEEPKSIAKLPPWSYFTWQVGPAVGKLSDVAEVKIPPGYLFVGREETQKIMEMLENPVSGTEIGLIMPDSKEDHWLAMFEYVDDGHVKDDDKDKIDADEILASIKEGNAASNDERKSRGWSTVDVTGWARPPHYNEQTKHLEWAVSAVSEGKPVLNYNTRLLGRTGVMSVVLLVAPEKLEAALPDYQKVVAAYGYVDGNRYGDYRQGDKLAEYGLAALMLGGGAAIAAKTGILMQLALLFKKAWKFLILGLAAGAAALRKLFAGLFGSKRVTLPQHQLQAQAGATEPSKDEPPQV
jgi:uncharacterized membrane-anchored protein